MWRTCVLAVSASSPAWNPHHGITHLGGQGWQWRGDDKSCTHIHAKLDVSRTRTNQEPVAGSLSRHGRRIFCRDAVGRPVAKMERKVAGQPSGRLEGLPQTFVCRTMLQWVDESPRSPEFCSHNMFPESMFPCWSLRLSCGNKIMRVGDARVTTAD